MPNSLYATTTHHRQTTRQVLRLDSNSECLDSSFGPKDKVRRGKKKMSSEESKKLFYLYELMNIQYPCHWELENHERTHFNHQSPVTHNLPISRRTLPFSRALTSWGVVRLSVNLTDSEVRVWGKHRDIYTLVVHPVGLQFCEHIKELLLFVTIFCLRILRRLKLKNLMEKTKLKLRGGRKGG